MGRFIVRWEIGEEWAPDTRKFKRLIDAEDAAAAVTALPADADGANASPPAPPPSNCSALSVAGSTSAVGSWRSANIISTSSSTVVVALSAQDKFEAASSTRGKMLIRYAWSAVPFAYKDGAVYVKAELLPAGPFVMVVV